MFVLPGQSKQHPVDNPQHPQIRTVQHLVNVLPDFRIIHSEFLLRSECMFDYIELNVRLFGHKTEYITVVKNGNFF